MITTFEWNEIKFYTFGSVTIKVKATPPLSISKTKITYTLEEGELVINKIKTKKLLEIHIDEYKHFTIKRNDVRLIANVIDLGKSNDYIL